MTLENILRRLERHIAKAYSGSNTLFADSIGEHRQTVSSAMNGRRLPSQKMLAAIGYKSDTVTIYSRIN